MNRLSEATSPYLLQHAENPVDWYPWSEEALSRARAEDKPIFLSIGYAACHWCHVMAHESFEDPETASLMNANFVNIKVDREERPDLDGIYMQSVVAMTGSGGWPMSVFLTPDLRPFHAGTYFPPVPRHNLPSFKDILRGVTRAWSEQRGDITRLGTQVLESLQPVTRETQTQAGGGFASESVDAAADSMLASYDWEYGGWGAAPKFPQPMSFEFLLAHAVLNPARAPELRKLVTHGLHAMARGGMYDVVGGGFARYSTDNHWRVPHFEKMLYDNALLARLFLHAWQVTQIPDFKRVAIETLDFVVRELSHAGGGFFSSLDADSEGEEGRFYAWTQDEIRKTLSDDADLFEAAYAVTARGNWEGRTILQRALDDSSLAARFHLDPETVRARLSSCHARLLVARSTRVRPGTDDKVLTAWNALMLSAFVEASRVLGEDSLSGPYYSMATRNADFLLSALTPRGKLARSWRGGRATSQVFLEDYAALILGLLELYQTDFQNRWFTSAVELADEMIDRFSDPVGGFFDTPANAEPLLVRPKDLQDNATPSGNALACECLLKLDALTGRARYREIVENALRLVAGPASRYPIAFGRWLSAAQLGLARIMQVAIIGDPASSGFKNMLSAVRATYRPSVIVAASALPPPLDAPALLADRPSVDGKVTAYVCEGFVCNLPVTDPDALRRQLS